MEVNYLLAFIAAMAVSMVIIPIMVRLAPRLGMLDLPDPRKVQRIRLDRDREASHDLNRLLDKPGQGNARVREPLENIFFGIS